MRSTSAQTHSLLFAVLGLLILAACASSEDSSGRSTRTCADIAECPSGEVCVDGTCVRASSRCVDNGDCPDDSTCERGVCTPIDMGADMDVAEVMDEEECFRPSDCPDDFSCTNNVCQDPDADMGDDLPVTDLPEEPDASDGGDCTPGVDCPDEPDSADECEGRDDGRLGESCDGASDCCSGLCLGNPEVGAGFCSERCNSYDECNPLGLPDEFFCYDAGVSGYLCAYSDYRDSCELAEDCLGQICLKGLGTTGCSWQCRTTADCPPNSACGPVFFDDGEGGLFALNSCAPVGTTCEVDVGTGLNNCLSGLCLTPDTGGAGFCSMICQSADPNACPFGYACELVDSEFPAVCNRI
jgi:hypothetical protein